MACWTIQQPELPPLPASAMATLANQVTGRQVTGRRVTRRPEEPLRRRMILAGQGELMCERFRGGDLRLYPDSADRPGDD